ncbi:fasciclin domain-containing protein [Lysobacter korlensis]|uniref:Fasciclin domain-containing protein n=1 Tax=Lysobacter korlensis TaxID=553636 RepID=A0ABV6RRT0_9GAMM
MKTALLVLAVTSALALAACSEPAEVPADTAAPTADVVTPEPAPVDPATTADAAPQNPMVGGAPMYANKDIVDNAVNSKDHTTLVAAVQAAGLVDTLKSPGPFTVFAPTNAAFEALPAGTVDGLLKPEKKEDLTKVLTYHVVSGKVDAATLKSQVQAGNGTATLTTVQGGTLTATASPDGGVTLTDAKGNKAQVTTADVMQSNGVIHVIDTVLMP